MKIVVTTQASMQEVMVKLLGGTPLKVPFAGAREVEIKSDLSRDRPILIVPSSPNSERRVRVPVKIPNLDAEGFAEFNFAVNDSNFVHPVSGARGLTIVIE
jgi:hypothetical protein